MGYAARNELQRFELEGVAENVRSLNSRQLGDAGAAVVAAFLEEQDVVAGGDSGGGGGGNDNNAVKATNALVRPTRLIHIGLAKNKIGERGMRVLLQAFTSGAPRVSQLQRVEVYCNRPSPQWGAWKD